MVFVAAVADTLRAVWRNALRDRPYLALLAAIQAFNLLDIVLTGVALQHGAIEVMPLTALLFTHVSFAIGALVKIAVVALLTVSITLTQYSWWRRSSFVELSLLAALLAVADINSLVNLVRLGVR